ncbi:MAG: hypothetical protein JXB49_26485 [Bacteroidales bacterium]|nr:hypothetical protein [Bacteroidales bacterium]MBN2821174.1 hypothetical protein [Bacteroidales bacterium]
MSYKKRIKRTIKNGLNRAIGDKRNKMTFLCKHCEFMRFVPPGHIYSPIPSSKNFKISERINQDVFEGLKFNEQKQLDLLTTLCNYEHLIPEFPDYPKENYRFFYRNNYFSYPDVSILICALLHFKIRKIVDIGGEKISPALILDLNETLFKDNPIELIVIQPELLASNIDQNNENLTIIKENIQDVDRSIFKDLQENDLVFLDTTHNIKRGSDVNYIAYHILPILGKGVKVHLHDIYYPFEYPKEYFFEGKYWNEIYFWKAFLMFNEAFEIELFNSYFEHKYRDFMDKSFSKYFNGIKGELAIQGMGSSLWLKRV